MAGFAMVVTLDELAAWLQSQAEILRTLDYRDPLAKCGLILVSRTRQCFDSQSGPDGMPWPGFKRTPGKRRGGQTAKLLRDTGILMASYSGGGVGHVEDLSQAELRWGSNVDYAGYQQFGTHTIPPRPAAGISDEVAEEIAEVFAEFLAQQLAG